jgi:hypothetical protein
MIKVCGYAKEVAKRTNNFLQKSNQFQIPDLSFRLFRSKEAFMLLAKPFFYQEWRSILQRATENI